MDRVGAWDDETWAAGGQSALRERTAELVAAVRATRRTVVAVTNEVGSGWCRRRRRGAGSVTSWAG